MSHDMINIQGLTKEYSGRGKFFFSQKSLIRAVDSISLSVKKGQTLGLVGESGSGKTTAVRSMLRLIKPTAGEIYFNGVPVHNMDREELRKFREKVQIVFQDPYNSLNPRMRVGKIITEPLLIHDKNSKIDLSQKMTQLLETVGLKPEHAERYPHEFSGGQRQRISIARALATDPDILILDEPVSALDVSIQAQILNLLKDLQKEKNLTCIFVAHDLAVVEYMSDTIAVMYLGRIVETGTKNQIYKNPLHPYTKSLLLSIPEFTGEKKKLSVVKGEIPSPENPPAGCHFHPRCPYKMPICEKIYPEFYDVNGQKVTCHILNT